MKLLRQCIGVIGMLLLGLLFLVTIGLSYFNDDQPTEDL